MPNPIHPNVTAKANFRSNVYRTLALAFTPPQADTETLYMAILDTYAAVHSIKNPSSSETSRPSDTVPTNLSKEHLRLFVGPGHIQCPPYESVYRKDRPLPERGLVMGPSTADVRRRYTEANLNMSKKFTDLPDQIAVEMEFMHFLCAEESKFTQQGDLQESTKFRKMQEEFLIDHLKPWTNAFADCILKSSNSPFYNAAANLLKEFIQMELEDSGSDTE